MTWRRAFLLSTLLALVLSVGATAGERGDRGEAVFVGQDISDRSAKVTLRVKSEGGRNKRAVFTIRNLPLFCEDSTTRQADEVRQTVQFSGKNHKSFGGERYRMDDDGTETFMELSGRLESKSRARGSFLYKHDPVNPPGSSAPPDCSGLSLWRARDTD